MSDASSSPDGRDYPILGSYKILRQLGSGGMSNVFQAIHEGSGSIVALKVLPRKLAQNAVLLQRFLREARSAENLDHPNIVAIYDRGFDQGRHYLVLEYVDGRDLHDRVRLTGPMGPDEAVAFIRQVAGGLQYAALQGMIHRDVKPANLLLTAEGQAKIIDLGLALQAAEEDERVTRDGTTVGTVDYMSPEQARDSRRISERSDIYSLGCTFHYILTGSPPYPGGTLADKLARHHSAEIPDVRDRNPQLPADLAALVRRMMAKKPEGRFDDYKELIEGLDRIGQGPATTADVTLPDVLIDDEDDSDDAIELTVASGSTPASHPSHPRLGGPRRDAPPSPGAIPAGVPPEISLAELAALDADDPPSSSRPRRSDRSLATSPRSSAITAAILEDDPSPTDPSVRRSRDELPLQTWIAAGISAGLLVAALAFGVRFALSFLDSPRPGPDATEAGRIDQEPEAEAERTVPPAEDRNPDGVYVVRPLPRPPINPEPAIRELVGPIPPPGFHVKPRPPILVEPSFPPGAVERLGFAASAPVTPAESAGKVTVRRLVDPGDAGQVATLALAFGRANDAVEIADAGPFHEDDCLLAGRSRVIRAAPGVRPMVMIQTTRQLLIREQEAKFMLGLAGVERLTIEGIDLVVDARDLPPSQSTLFLCQGVDLTLRDCSITLVNVDDRRSGFSVFRLAAGPRPNRIRLERSLIRGPVETLVQVQGGAAEVALDRSVVLGSAGPIFQFDAAEPAARMLRLSRSVLAARGPIAAWMSKATPTTIRSLGTTYARVESPGPGPAFVARGVPPAELGSWLDFDGEADRWVGWSALGQWGAGVVPTTGVRAALRATWPAAEVAGHESASAWPAAAIAESATAARLVEWVPEDEATLRRVAAPSPYLLGQTVDLFPRLGTPELRDQFAFDPTSAPQPVVALTLDLQAPGRDDLGLFLREQIKDAGKRYVVRIQGTGTHPMTPVRLPDGASVAIIGPTAGTSAPVPIFVAAQSGVALIELHGGDLALENLGFAGDGAFRTRHWLRVQDGWLGVRRCRYRDPAAEPAAAAIAFVASGTDRPEPRVGPFKAAPDRPLARLVDCWIWTTGDAVSAELGRGVVDLKNCVVVAGPAAFRLQAASTGSVPPEADLVLENCTVADDRFGVAFDLGPDAAPRFGRPWAVFTRSSIFPRIARDNGALLGVDPRGFAVGGLFWQSSNDLYEVNRFIGPADLAAGPSSSADLKRHWADVWGVIHTRGDRGPDPRKTERIIRLRDKDRPRTTRPTPAQLELEPNAHPGQGADFKRLPPFPKP